jgi:hypothetical protein
LRTDLADRTDLAARTNLADRATLALDAIAAVTAERFEFERTDSPDQTFDQADGALQQ